MPAQRRRAARLGKGQMNGQNYGEQVTSSGSSLLTFREARARARARGEWRSQADIDRESARLAEEARAGVASGLQRAWTHVASGACRCSRCMEEARARARAGVASGRRVLRAHASARGDGRRVDVDRATVTLRASAARRVWLVGVDGVASGAVLAPVTAQRVRVTVGLADGLARLVGDVHQREGQARRVYLDWWTGQDGRAIDDAAKRAARSVRAGKVSDTSRIEAQAAAREVITARVQAIQAQRGLSFQAALRVVTYHPPGTLPGRANRYRVAHGLAVAWTPDRRGNRHLVASVAAARASLRGELLGGVKGRDSDLRGRAAMDDDGATGAVWSIGRGEWVKVRRVDGAQAVDQAGRMICELRGQPSGDVAADTRARDAVRLVSWLASRRCGVRGNWSNATRARVRGSAAKLARVLRAVARGESMPLAVRAVGWSWDEHNQRSDGFRRAVESLTNGAGLADAWRDFRADCAAGIA